SPPAPSRGAGTTSASPAAMKVLVLAPNLPDTAPSMRFRMEQWAPYLQDGCQLTFAPFEDEALHDLLYQPGYYGAKALLMLRAFLRRLELPRRATEYDVIFLHREAAAIGPQIVELLLSRSGIPIVYDFDDPVWLP